MEETALGKNVDVLLFAITGGGATQDTLSPFNYVSFRLLQRLADSLAPIQAKPALLDPYRPGVDVLHELFQHSESNFKGRISREQTSWKPQQELPTTHTKDFQQQHEWFTLNSGIPLLRMFLTKKVPAFETWLKSACSPIYERSNMTIKDQLEQARAKYEDSKDSLEVIKLLHTTSQGDTGRDMLRKALMRQEVAQFH